MLAYIKPADIKRYGMDAGIQITQRPMHGPMSCNSSQFRETRRADLDAEVALARTIMARMTCVHMAFINDLKHFRCECCPQSCLNLVFYSHFFLHPLQSSAQSSKLCRPSREAYKQSPRNDQMVDKSPFDFDIRVSSDKKKKKTTRRGMSGAYETSNRKCDFPSCAEHAAYRAPKSPDMLDEFFWFCKEHVREYNLRWNFFEGTSDDEFQRFLDNARHGERPTKPFSRQGDGNAWARLGIDDPMQLLGEKATQNPGKQPVGGATRKLPPTERKALEILDCRDTMSKPEIRKAYKGLIKILHPDMNGGDRSQEEQLQEVVWAWDQIKDSRYFRD